MRPVFDALATPAARSGECARYCGSKYLGNVNHQQPL
jgi:hypothetical protein